jgi:RHS repeat-associated protein
MSGVEQRRYVGGLWEERTNGTTRSHYLLNGQTMAVRETSGSSSVVSYLHGDHLGSVALSTTSGGAIASQQEFDAWGKIRSGGVSQTKRNYTGQILDGTGLLYYNARYYDPAIGRFISADTVVPGNASGGMEGVAVKPLTVGFHETQFLSKVNQENGLGFWFQLSDREREEVGTAWGPENAQALNRYSYVLNNPLKYTDPTGHHPFVAVLAFFGIASAGPIIAVLAVAFTVVTLATFLSDAGNRAWLGEQIRDAYVGLW